MAKLTVDIDQDTHKILKQLASKQERSLTQYIQRTLRQVAGTLVVNEDNSLLHQRNIARYTNY